MLFERCLIACALYEEFWAKYAEYLEGRKADDKDKDDEKVGSETNLLCDPYPTSSCCIAAPVASL